MKKQRLSGKNRTQVLGRALAGAAAVVFCGQVSAEVENELDELVVSSLRLPKKASESTSAVTVLDLYDLEQRGIFDLREALNEVPGVIGTSTAGQTGAVGSVFIRGTTTAYSQLVVDGVRLSDSTAQLGNFFSGARLDDFGRVEVLRGPHAAVYGGEAVGGVLWLETERGSGDPRTNLRLEGGSFDSMNGYLSNSGSTENFSWFVGGGYDTTENDAISQQFDQGRVAMRLEWAANQNLTLGMTFRATDTRFAYISFGSRNIDYTDSDLTTIYANTRLAEGWDASFRLGRFSESYDNEGAFGNFGTDIERTVFVTDHRVQVAKNHAIIGGAFWENSDFENTIQTDEHEQRYGTHFGWEWNPIAGFVTDAVVRWEDYGNFDDQLTWRVGASWQALEKTRLRAGVGEAFRIPTYLDLFGTQFGAGNPNLSAEESLGWDVGVEQMIGDAHSVSLTYFENSIDSRIRSFPTPPVNLPGDTPTRGIEFAGEFALAKDVKLRTSWTYLEESLADMPENIANASLVWNVSEKLSLGCGASYMDDRSFGGLPLDEFILLRIHGSYALTDKVKLHARVENLADENYELSNFFGNVIEGAGVGAFVGVTAEF